MIAPRVVLAPARDDSDRQGHTPSIVVLHATVGTNSLGWLKGNPDRTSIHVLIAKNGDVYRMVDDERAAHHCGFSRIEQDGIVYSERGPSPNLITLGIELENLNNGKDPYPEAQLRSAAWVIQGWFAKYGKLHVVMHRDIDQHGKTDAAGISIHDALRFLSEDASTPSPVITGDSAICAPARATMEQAIAYTLKRKTTYSEVSVREIAGHYWTYAQAVGVDPCIAYAQMVHETGNITSWWSQRPRRNPAGIGVTGRWSRRDEGAGWSYDARNAYWKEGWSFETWDLASKAHIGHLLVYAVGVSRLNPAQTDMVKFDPRMVAVPRGYHGCAPTLNGLNGKWAVPGTTYGSSIAAIAEAIRQS